MTTYALQITEDTLELITTLNGGITPEIEKEKTFFIYRGEDAHADIISSTELLRWIKKTSTLGPKAHHLYVM